MSGALSEFATLPTQPAKGVHEMDFYELGNVIEGGQMPNASVFLNRFLETGAQHWQGLADKEETNEAFRPTYKRLADEYQQTLHGKGVDKIEFCEREAGARLEMAEELRGLKDELGAKKQEEKASFWYSVGGGITLF